MVSKMYKEMYSRWLAANLDDPDLKPELESIQNDDAAIQDRFAVALKFGTAGLRGVIGAGTNRMNVYVVRQATQGLANWVKTQGGTQTVAISYDSRIKSDVFAKAAAEVLAANGVKVRIYSALMPVPALSFATRYYNCNAGIMVTASHNPAKYNGYKAYGPDGCQMTDEAADIVYAEIQKTDILTGAKTMPFAEGLEKGIIEYVGDDCINALYEAIEARSIRPGICKTAGLKLVYSPLNGSGLVPVTHVLHDIGITDITVVPEQEKPDGNFPTVAYPNPESPKAFELALALAKKVDADIVLATDPDADRLGVYCKDTKSGQYVSFTGNMSGMLIAEYILKERTATGTMPQDPALVETIVTTDMAKVIAEAYGVKLIEVLTGFKYIGEQIRLFEENHTYHYVFGLEESYGCLAGTYARDKDACVAVMMLCEVASWYKKQGKTLWDAMLDMYETYGYFKEGLETITLKGMDGAEQIQQMMADARENLPQAIGDYKVLAVRDYKTDLRIDMADGSKSPTGLPTSNVLYYELEDHAWCCVRPSGTEPKIKFYFGVKGASLADAEDKLEDLTKGMMALFDRK